MLVLPGKRVRSLTLLSNDKLMNSDLRNNSENFFAVGETFLQISDKGKFEKEYHFVFIKNVNIMISFLKKKVRNIFLAKKILFFLI